MKAIWALLWITMVALIGFLATLTLSVTIGDWTTPSAGVLAILLLGVELCVALPLKGAILCTAAVIPLYFGTGSYKTLARIAFQYASFVGLTTFVQGMGLVLYLYLPSHGYKPLDMTIPYLLQTLAPVTAVLLTLGLDALAGNIVGLMSKTSGGVWHKIAVYAGFYV